MKKLPQKLQDKLVERKQFNALRQLPLKNALIDFSSNDYIGFSRNKELFEASHDYLVQHQMIQNGATGSRLLSGNFPLYEVAEKYIAEFHESESALIYNSGYDANLGFFSAVLQKGDVVLYDEIIHASIRDGVRMSLANAFKFKHNDNSDLEQKIIRHTTKINTIYVVTESVFSMDGDAPDLKLMVELCQKYNAYLVVDEAHALGVKGKNGVGMLQEANLQNKVFARIVTFGKGLGCHGAAVLGSEQLRMYLINFSRSFIYTTGLSPHSIASIYMAYCYLNSDKSKAVLDALHTNIRHFNTEIKRLDLIELFVTSTSSIHCCVLSGNEVVKKASQFLIENGYNVKPILSPTVPVNQERLRFCIHSYNSKAEITNVLELLSKFVQNQHN